MSSDTLGNQSEASELSHMHWKECETRTTEYQDQFIPWHYYQTKQHQADSYRVAQRRAESIGKFHCLVDQSGALLDLIDSKNL